MLIYVHTKSGTKYKKWNTFKLFIYHTHFHLNAVIHIHLQKVQLCIYTRFYTVHKCILYSVGELQVVENEIITVTQLKKCQFDSRQNCAT